MKKILWGIVGLVAGIIAGFLGTTYLPGSESFGAQRLSPLERTVMSAAGATTTGSSMNVADYRYIGWTVATANGVSGTLRFACSMSDAAPTFSAATSTTNRWDYVDVTDLLTDNSIDGATGLVMANVNSVKQVLMENVPFRWCTAILSPWTNGTTTVTMLPATFQ